VRARPAAKARTLIAIDSAPGNPCGTTDPHQPHRSGAPNVTDSEGTMPYGFGFKSAFLNLNQDEVTGDGPPYRIETRQATTPAQDAYQRSIFTGDDEQWERDVIGATNLLFRVPDSDQPLPQAVVEAFNAWRAQDGAEQLAAALSRFERLDGINPEHPMVEAPAVVQGAYYVTGRGWLVNGTKECSAARGGNTAEDMAPASAVAPTRLDTAGQRGKRKEV
jgi:hypothetical protein